MDSHCEHPWLATAAAGSEGGKFTLQRRFSKTGLSVSASTLSTYVLESSNGLAVRLGMYLPTNRSGWMEDSAKLRLKNCRKDWTPGRRRLLWNGTLTLRGIVARPRWRTTGPVRISNP